MYFVEFCGMQIVAINREMSLRWQAGEFSQVRVRIPLGM